MSEEQYKRLQARPEKGRQLKIGPIGKIVAGSGGDGPEGRLDPLAGVQAPKKFRNRPTGGYASVHEARDAQALKLRLAAGEISDLREQVPFILIPAQYDENRKVIERQCIYVADFVYIENGKKVVQDSKGVRTADYVIKRKLLLMVHGIRIRET